MCCQAKASKQGQPPGSHFIPEKKAEFGMTFYMENISKVKKIRKAQKKFLK